MGTFIQESGIMMEMPGKTPSVMPGAGTTRMKKTGDLQVVEFILGTKLFAINLFDTKEVINQPVITPLPDAPEFITGIIDLRGVITTIVDLKSLMNITIDAEEDHKSRVIILDSAISSKVIGVLVDDVLAVTSYPDSMVDLGGGDGNGAKNRLGIIRKTVKEGDREGSELVILIDIKGIIKRIESSL
ncbi:MAG: purine-binding chemotaxis protein CheW [Methanospirillaceae archaeon]|nr:purine-binding chemotaxis protein CheW [Methanospirillaceae archaeon]